MNAAGKAELVSNHKDISQQTWGPTFSKPCIDLLIMGYMGRYVLYSVVTVVYIVS